MRHRVNPVSGDAARDSGRDSARAAAAALAAGLRLGPFFAVSSAPEPAGSWRGLPELCDDEVLAELVHQTRGRLARGADVNEQQVPKRVPASILSLSIFSRLVSPLLAAALTQGLLPEVGPETLWWQPVSHGVMPVAMTPRGTTWTGDALTVAGQLSLAVAFEEAVLIQLVDPVVAAFRRLGVSPVVLRGNVVSALGGAVTMLDEDSGWSVLKLLVSRAYLLETAVVGDSGMRRRSCCLIYQVPGIGYCGDCVLAG